MLFRSQANGKNILTIEGVCEEKLHILQELFIKTGGSQCGMCTPGMILAAIAYMKNPDIASSLPQALAGNLCRCTGYTKIFEACEKLQFVI